MSPEIAELLKRVRAGSIDAEHEIGLICSRAPAIEWMPIETAPVLSIAEVLTGGNVHTYRFPCLIQTSTKEIMSGMARYAKKQGMRSSTPDVWRLQWYGARGQLLPRAKYWMPLPTPREG